MLSWLFCRNLVKYIYRIPITRLTQFIPFFMLFHKISTNLHSFDCFTTL
jgi:hypothetical protein